ncbi:uncharacterized protein LOC122035839 [Zingiber officinale]|uniref:uncharacterized protein LOC122035371 n=1 Tax=Zingiber officinale TaxID=94328 RepID=UPI001C4B017C|nr:uncharacterized protein LOC122035371 [Zingiber officinale]XP_042450905.1 uncharacterized protein LOC122035839 [Zingiber officinale]
MVSEISTSLSLDGGHFDTEFENIVCPICLDTPHNAVLLKCSSYDKGCRAFMCDTDTSLSNCLGRYKHANGVSTTTMVNSITSEASPQNFQVIPLNFDGLTCPFCRGDVTGFSVVVNARAYLNMKKRCCEEKHCGYASNYLELQQHAKREHPNSRPSEVDPERQRDWESFQRSLETTDIMSAIRSEVYRMLFGNCIMDYEDESDDEFDDFSGDECNWQTSSYHISDGFMSPRHQPQSRNERRIHPRSSSDVHIDDQPLSSSHTPEDFNRNAEIGETNNEASYRGNHSRRR